MSYPFIMCNKEYFMPTSISFTIFMVINDIYIKKKI